MIPVKFPEANVVLGAQQDQYEPLPIHRGEAPERRVTMQFRLTPEELEEVKRTRSIWLQQLTFGAPFQPIALSVMRPAELALTVEIPATAETCTRKGCGHYWGDHAYDNWEPGKPSDCGYPGCKCREFAR